MLARGTIQREGQVVHVVVTRAWAGQGYLDMDDLPSTLRSLTPDQVEDFFCIYKRAFNGRARKLGSCRTDAPGRGWC